MIKYTTKLGSIVLPLVVLLSVMLSSVPKVDVYENLNGFYLDNEYKLKFVDSVDYELGLSDASKIIMPVTILKAELDSLGWIKLTTYENSVVYTPIETMVVGVDSVNKIVKLKTSKITIELKNLICGQKEGVKLFCGDVIGSVQGNVLLVKVFWGDKLLSLEELEAII